jgi:hypothetical protein
MPLVITQRGDRTYVVCKPRPPKIGSAYVQPIPRANRHAPDQDLIQAALIGIPQRTMLRELIDLYIGERDA